jgi:DNA-3-methyladenine glycosylase II
VSPSASAFGCSPRGAFSLRAANEYFGGWVNATDGGATIPMAFPVEGWETSAAVVVTQGDEGRVTGEVTAPAAHADAAWQQALAVLSLDVDGGGFAAVGPRDPRIGELQQRYAGLRPVLFHSPYEAAAAFIVGHRISIAQGRAIRKRMAEQVGAHVDTAQGTVHAFPAPEALLELPSFPGVADAKIARLHGVARAALDGVLDRARLRALPEADALALLRGIDGVGPFFAQGILMRGAGLVDTVTDDDVTKQAVQRRYGLAALPAHGDVLEIAERWRPYRMWASVLLHVWLRREQGGSRH